MSRTLTDNVHGAHAYPCRFPPATPRELLAGDGTFLDPFCGSGTALVEAARRGSVERVIGWDCNPIAVLIARYKTLEVSDEFVATATATLDELAFAASSFATSERELHDFAGRDHWFAAQVQHELAAVLAWIRETAVTPELQTWLNCALSSIVTRVSYQDSDTRYARVEYDVTPGQAARLFEERARLLLDALLERGPLDATIDIELVDVMDGFPLGAASVDEIVTSPPYANTMDYYLYHKQRMNILGLDFKAAQRAEIGSRWEYSSMKANNRKWRDDLSHVIAEIARVLREDGRATLIIGDSQIDGELINAAELVQELSAHAGLLAAVEESIPMSQRSRSFSAAFQRPNKHEHVITLGRR